MLNARPVLAHMHPTPVGGQTLLHADGSRAFAFGRNSSLCSRQALRLGPMEEGNAC